LSLPNAVLLFALLVLVTGCSGLLWDLTQGTQRLHLRRGDFTDGTTRHPRSYDETLTALCDCAWKNFGVVVHVTVDSLFRGGIYLTNAGVSTYGRLDHTLHIADWCYDMQDCVTHEMGHALTNEEPRLRNPADQHNDGGEFDHASDFFHRCVPYCPVAQEGCR
jgi:hypothetical protein